MTVRNFVFGYRPHPDRPRAYNDRIHPDIFQQYKNGTTLRDVVFENGVEVDNVVSNKVVNGLDGVTVQTMDFKQLPSQFGGMDFDLDHDIVVGAAISRVADVTGGDDETPTNVQSGDELDDLKQQVTMFTEQIVALQEIVTPRSTQVIELQEELTDMHGQMTLIDEQVRVGSEQIESNGMKLTRLESWAGGFVNVME